MGTIHLNNHGISPAIKHKSKLKGFLTDIFKNEKVLFKKLTYIFCKDDFLLDLNKQYLEHDTLTDILTFTLSEVPSIVSEIYISVERVKENALLLKVTYEEELVRVMIHGILHLCGYKDHSLKEKKAMRKREDFYLAKFSFT